MTRPELSAVAAGESLTVSSLSVTAGTFRLRDVSFTLPGGGYGVVVGPAGAGKTTLLEALAGLRPATGGTVTLGGRSIGALRPEERAVGLVYQHAYLFPHLTVAGNVAYGAVDRPLATELLGRFGAAHLAGRGVGSLSGGERQLVALVRALARRPRLLLLDEPFGALDPRRRRAVRGTMKALQHEWALTTLHVTHDFAEADALGDVLMVLDGGRVQQVGAPAEVFRQPASAAVAGFLGAENVLTGMLRESDPVDAGDRVGEPRLVEVDVGALTLHAVSDRRPGPVNVVLHASDMMLERPADAGGHHVTSASNMLAGRVVQLTRLGVISEVTLDVSGVTLIAAITTRSAREMELRQGDDVLAIVKALSVHLC